MPDAPPSVTQTNLSGLWIVSKDKSDDMDAMLALQGLSFLLRKVARLGTIQLRFQHDPEASPPKLIMTVMPPGGFKIEVKEIILDGRWWDENSIAFGNIRNAWRVVQRTDVEDPFQREAEWEEDVLLEEIIEKPGQWKHLGYWGITTMDGVRGLTKKIVVRKGEKKLTVTGFNEYVSA